jgi:cellulose synthase/poly-beta-1,6-N-acetylglucosamine synthase-like glycosyltransferase
MVKLVLLFFLLVAVAAACNVVSGLVGLGLVPAFPGSEWFFIVKNYIANLVLWTILAVILMGAIQVYRERRERGGGEALGRERDPLPENPRIAVALTAYNDELSVGDAVRDFKLQPNVDSVFVVDNNCHDRTAEVAQKAGATVVTERRQGYGWACQRGLRAALETGADIIVLSEGDGTFSGRSISNMIPFLEDADMVIGNRVTPGFVDLGSQMDSFFVWGNQLGAKLLQLRFWEPRFLGRVQLSDLGCTYRAIRREALREIIDELTVGGMHFSPHMIMVALREGHDIVEVPIRFWPRVGVSKGASSLVAAVRIGVAMLWHIVTFPVRPLAHGSEAAHEAKKTGRRKTPEQVSSSRSQAN